MGQAGGAEPLNKLRHPLNFLIRKDVRFVLRTRRKLTHHRALFAGDKPVWGVGFQCALVTGFEVVMLEHGEGVALVFGDHRRGRNLFRRCPFCDRAGRGALRRRGGGRSLPCPVGHPPRVAVFRADLPGHHGQFFGAAAVGVDVDQNGQTQFVVAVEAEIGDFDVGNFLFLEMNAGAGCVPRLPVGGRLNRGCS